MSFVRFGWVELGSVGLGLVILGYIEEVSLSCLVKVDVMVELS